MGVTRTGSMPGLPGNNNFKILYAGATSSATRSAYRPHGDQHRPRAGRGRLPSARLLLPGLQVGREMVHALYRDSRGRSHGQPGFSPGIACRADRDDASGKVTSVIYFDADGKLQRQHARVVSVAGNSIERPRLLLNSASSKLPDGLANCSGQVGRNYMRHTTGSVFAIFKEPVHMYRGTMMAGIVRDEARIQSEPRFCRRLRNGNALARPAIRRRVPQSGRMGTRLHQRYRQLFEYGRDVDRRRGHAAGNEPDHAQRPEGQMVACR